MINLHENARQEAGVDPAGALRAGDHRVKIERRASVCERAAEAILGLPGSV